MNEPTMNERKKLGGSSGAAPCSADRDGNWLDEWGACKVCDGEIPHGHTNNCDIYKLECEIRRLRDALKTVLASAHPHPMENGVMYEAWETAKKALSPNDASDQRPPT